MCYLFLNDIDCGDMFVCVGVNFIDDLFVDIFVNVCLEGLLDLLKCVSEMIVECKFFIMVVKNMVVGLVLFFVGVGVYKYYVLVIVDYLI